MKKEFSAGIVVYHKDNSSLQFLLLKYTAGHWDLPKGHIEAQENKHDAALRELYEETGICQVTIDPNFEEAFEYFFTNKNHEVVLKKVFFFLGRVSDPKVKLSSEHTDYIWLDYKNTLKQLTYKNAQILIKKAYAFLHQQEHI